MSNKHASLEALFTDLSDAIREKTGDTGTIHAVEFPGVIRERLEADPPPPYLTFSSPSSFTLNVNDTTKHWDGTLEYSTDASTWSTWDGTTTLSSATSGSDNVLYLRGTGNTVITGNNLGYKWVLTGSNIACIGNIENLLDYAMVEAGNHPTMANYCYHGMFYKCASLTQVPALPATTLATNCYNSMFFGCTSLTQAPALPATTLANYCYNSMFRGCTRPVYTADEVGAAPASHVSDATVHITADERAAWNGKAEGTHASQHASGGSDPITPAAIGAIPITQKGAANGVATLGDDGKVPAEQLPAMDYAPSSHVSDTTKHITADERAAWNAKASTAYVDEAVQTAIGNAIGGSY